MAKTSVKAPVGRPRGVGNADSFVTRIRNLEVGDTETKTSVSDLIGLTSDTKNLIKGNLSCSVRAAVTRAERDCPGSEFLVETSEQLSTDGKRLLIFCLVTRLV